MQLKRTRVQTYFDVQLLVLRCYNQSYYVTIITDNITSGTITLKLLKIHYKNTTIMKIRLKLLYHHHYHYYYSCNNQTTVTIPPLLLLVLVTRTCVSVS